MTKDEMGKELLKWGFSEDQFSDLSHADLSDFHRSAKNDQRESSAADEQDSSGDDSGLDEQGSSGDDSGLDEQDSSGDDSGLDEQGSSGDDSGLDEQDSFDDDSDEQLFKMQADCGCRFKSLGTVIVGDAEFRRGRRVTLTEKQLFACDTTTRDYLVEHRVASLDKG